MPTKLSFSLKCHGKLYVHKMSNNIKLIRHRCQEIENPKDIDQKSLYLKKKDGYITTLY